MTQMRLSEISNMVAGCIIGTAVGDALGMPTEGMSRENIIQEFGLVSEYQDSKSRFSKGLVRGNWTDDTKLTAANLEGLTEYLSEYFNGAIDVNKICEIILSRYLKALEDHRRRGFGKTTRESLNARKEGKDPFADDHKSQPGNGCAMKSAIFGIFSALCDMQGVGCDLRELIIKTSLMTHNDSRSISAAGVQALAAKMIFNKKDLSEYENFMQLFNEALVYEKAFEKYPAIKNERPEISEILPLVFEMASDQTPDDFIAYSLKTGGAAFESFPTALAYAIKYRNDFYKAVCAGANAGGDTDSIAAMSGALVGTNVGSSGIPRTLIDNLEARDYLSDCVSAFMSVTFEDR